MSRCERRKNFLIGIYNYAMLGGGGGGPWPPQSFKGSYSNANGLRVIILGKFLLLLSLYCLSILQSDQYQREV